MTTEKIRGLIEASGAEIAEDGRSVCFPDEELGSYAPVCRITSLEKAPVEIGRFARFFNFEPYEAFEVSWQLPAEKWTACEWDAYEHTRVTMDLMWKELALCLLLADADDEALREREEA
ncbi:MAG: hypothetical protein HDQ87_05435 [Clostridia bacterium]|nr:hypothetical protein [Clostridia bacterium]